MLRSECMRTDHIAPRGDHPVRYYRFFGCGVWLLNTHAKCCWWRQISVRFLEVRVCTVQLWNNVLQVIIIQYSCFAFEVIVPHHVPWRKECKLGWLKTQPPHLSLSLSPPPWPLHPYVLLHPLHTPKSLQVDCMPPMYPLMSRSTPSGLSEKHYNLLFKSEVHTSKGIWRQGIVLKHRNSLQKSLCPVVTGPYLCSSV